MWRHCGLSRPSTIFCLTILCFRAFDNNLLNSHQLGRSVTLKGHFGHEYVGYIAYADDILLLSASATDLQKMRNIFYIVGSDLDIRPISMQVNHISAKLAEYTMKILTTLF